MDKTWTQYETLLDSGALGSSFASQLWVQQHPEAIMERRNIDYEVKFGDSKTSQKLKEEVKVRVAVKDSNGKKHSADIWCKVQKSLAKDFFII